MQNIVQTHKNGIAPRIARQTKSPKAKPVIVIFYSTEDGKELFRAEFPADFYAKIIRACKKMKMTTSEFFTRAVKDKLNRQFEINITAPKVEVAA